MKSDAPKPMGLCRGWKERNRSVSGIYLSLPPFVAFPNSALIAIYLRENSTNSMPPTIERPGIAMPSTS